MAEEFNDDLIKFQHQSEFIQDLSKTLSAFRKDGRFCDVNLMVGGSIVKAHRNVLAARSQYFEAMFSGNFQESDNGVVEIDMTNSVESVEILEIAVNSLYDGYCIVTMSNVLGLFHLASFFLLEELKDELRNRLHASTYTTLDYVIHSYTLAFTYDISSLKNRSLHVIQSRFHDYFIYQENMLALSINQMKDLFEANIHRYCSPVKIILFLLRWIQHNSQDEKRYALESVELLRPIIKQINPDILQKANVYLEEKKNDQISREFIANIQDMIHTVSTEDKSVINQNPSDLMTTKSKCLVLVVPDKDLINYVCKKEYEYTLNKTDGKKMHMFHSPRKQQVMKLVIYEIELENWFEIGNFTAFSNFDNKNNWKIATVNDYIYFVSLHIKVCYSLCLKSLMCHEICIKSILECFNGKIKSLIPLAVDGELYILASNCLEAQVISNEDQYITQQKYFKLNNDHTWSVMAEVEHNHTNTPASLINASGTKVIAIKANIVVSLGKNLLEIKDGHVFDTVTSTVKKFSGPCYLCSPVRLLIKGDNLHIIDAEGWKRQYDWEIQEWMFPEKIDLSLVRWCRSIANDTDYPCLSHVATNAGDSIWEMCHDSAFSSLLLKIDIDDNGELQTSKHTPPPFKYFTLCTSGMCSYQLLKSLKDSQYMHPDL